MADVSQEQPPHGAPPVLLVVLEDGSRVGVANLHQAVGVMYMNAVSNDSPLDFLSACRELEHFPKDRIIIATAKNSRGINTCDYGLEIDYDPTDANMAHLQACPPCIVADLLQSWTNFKGQAGDPEATLPYMFKVYLTDYHRKAKHKKEVTQGAMARDGHQYLPANEAIQAALQLALATDPTIKIDVKQLQLASTVVNRFDATNLANARNKTRTKNPPQHAELADSGLPRPLYVGRPPKGRMPPPPARIPPQMRQAAAAAAAAAGAAATPAESSCQGDSAGAVGDEGQSAPRDEARGSRDQLQPAPRPASPPPAPRLAPPPPQAPGRKNYGAILASINRDTRADFADGQRVYIGQLTPKELETLQTSGNGAAMYSPAASRTPVRGEPGPDLTDVDLQAMCGDDPNRPDLLPELLAIHKDVGLDVTQIALVASALQELRSTKLKCFMKLDEPDRWLQLVYATLYQLKASYSAAPLQLQDAAQVSQVTAAKEKLEAAEACTARLAQQRRQLSQALRTACQLVDIVDATTRDLLRAQSASKAGIDAALQRVKQPVVEPYRRAHAAITTHLVYGGHEHEGPYSLEPEQIAGSAVEGRTPDVPACEPANLAPTLQQLAECVASIPGMVASLQELAAQLAGEHAAAVATGVQAAGWLLTQAPTQHTPGSATPSGGATTPKAYSGRTHDNETAGPGVTAAQVWEAHEAYSRKTGRMPSSREECNEAICDYLKNARQAAGSGAGAGSQQHDVSDQAGSRSAPSQEDGGGTPDGDSTASPRPHDGLLLDPAALLTGSQLEADEAAQAVAAALPGGLQHKKRKADEGEAPGQDGKQRKVVDPDGTASVDETELTPQLPGSAVDSSLVPATMYSSGA